MQKDFDLWNKLKKTIDAKKIRRDLFFYEREIWWCSVGINIGVEANGKHGKFERPVLILKKFNGQMIWIVPLTSKQKSGEYFEKIEHEKGISYACVTQMRIIGTGRLLRKLGTVSEQHFENVKQKIIILLEQSEPRISAGLLGGRSH
jgi:mRNA interferase MazF